MGHMTVFLSVCPSDRLWVGTLTSLCDDVLRQITSRRGRERLVPRRKPVSVAQLPESGKSQKMSSREHDSRDRVNKAIRD